MNAILDLDEFIVLCVELLLARLCKTNMIKRKWKLKTND